MPASMRAYTPSNDASTEALVDKFMPFIRGTALNLSRGLPPCLSTEDLISEGIFALLAIRQRRAELQEAFRSYAFKRIKGGMLDLVRRSVKKARKRPGKMAMEEQEVSFSPNPRLKAFMTDLLNFQVSETSTDPEATLEKKELLEALERFRRSLPEPQRIVTCFLYQWEFTTEYSGKLMGLSRRRVVQLHGEALKSLKRSMNAMVLQK